MSETAWLIEANGSYWTGQNCERSSFHEDVNQAMRFARKKDAQCAASWLLTNYAFALRATEHVFL